MRKTYIRTYIHTDRQTDRQTDTTKGHLTKCKTAHCMVAHLEQVRLCWRCQNATKAGLLEYNYNYDQLEKG